MKHLRVKLSDLRMLGGLPEVPDLPTLTALVSRHFAFLPQPLSITLDGDSVVIQHPEEPSAHQAEAVRLALKGGKKAAEGDYARAVELLQRALALQPSLTSARRDLAMTCLEQGDTEGASNHLIDVLRLDPSDAWGWVVLGNLYLGKKNDPETGEKFLLKGLELKPGDAWALNSLAALRHQQGRRDEAVQLYEQAISAHPDFANPYLGLSLTLAASGRLDPAADTLQRLFQMGRLQDHRTRPVYDKARSAYAELQARRAERDESELFKCVLAYKTELEALSGFPVRLDEDELPPHLGARIQMAWVHGRPYHRLTTRRSNPAQPHAAPCATYHLQAHELTHLKIEAEARQAGRNRFFTSTPETFATAHQALAADADKLRRSGKPAAAVQKMHHSLIQGLCGFLYNAPLDMCVERHLHRAYPVLRSAQFVSTVALAREALAANTHAEILRVTPRKLVRASLALNGAYALFLDDLYAGATTLAESYRKLDNFDMARRLYQHWQQRADACTGAGREYDLVDEFADMLGLREWYAWQSDPGPGQAEAEPEPEGSTNPDLLRRKHPAAVWHLLSALERYAKLTAEQVREIAFEIADVGQRGLDYANPEPQYRLRTLPGEIFSGLQLLCLMHAGFRRIAPDQDTGIDLDEPFLQALSLYEQKHGPPS